MRLRRRSLFAAALAWAAIGCKHPDSSAETEERGVPGRVVSQTILSDQVLWKLGPDVRQRVVGVSSLVDDDRYSNVAERWPSNVPRVQTTVESIVARRPDLTILADFTAAEVRQLLEQAGIALLVLGQFDGFDAYRRHVTEIAEAVGAQAEGKRLIQRFDRQLAEIRRSVTEQAPTIMSWNDGMVAGRGTTFHDEAKAAGFRNAAAIHEVTGHARVTAERILTWDPDFIVVSCGQLTCSAARRKAARRPELANLSAAEAGRIIALPSRLLYATGSAMLDVVERLVRYRAQPGAAE